MSIDNVEDFYTITTLIGRGSFGEVWKGYRKDDPNVPYALKFIDYTEENEYLVMNEIENIRNIALYPNCKNVHLGCYHSAYLTKYRGVTKILIIMDFYMGLTLKDYFNRMITSESKKRQIVFDLFSALYVLHSNGVYHRDIKPENIIVSFDGQIHLIDFGISCTISTCTSDAGTPGYIAPDSIIKNYQYIPETVDIFEMGMTLIVCFGNLNFFTFPDDPWGFKAQREVIKQFKDTYFSDRDVREILLSCIDTNPISRPSAQQVLEFMLSKNMVNN